VCETGTTPRSSTADELERRSATLAVERDRRRAIRGVVIRDEQRGVAGGDLARIERHLEVDDVPGPELARRCDLAGAVTAGGVAPVAGGAAIDVDRAHVVEQQRAAAGVRDVNDG
jgi:hypothetical protein